jgi:Uma2 family endonuclease
MVRQLTSRSGFEQESPFLSDVIYPDTDGRPMSDNTKQYLWIVLIKEGLEWLFANDLNVFVAGDLLWYPVEGNNKIRIGPDVLVAFGRPKGHRGSYQQWKEDNIIPQVVFEVRSPGNTQTEMDVKQVFYDRYGVEEYYLYDPDKNDLSGWLRSGERLEVINPISGWVSPRLGVRFELSETELEIYRPDGQRFATYVEMAQRAEQERLRAEQAQYMLEQERQRAKRLAERLRAAGIDPDEELS